MTTEPTRMQENTLDRMCEAYGRLLVRHGYADRTVRVTVETGKHFKISEAGTLISAGFDHTDDALAFREAG
jgi:hypothetical protein